LIFIIVIVYIDKGVIREKASRVHVCSLLRAYQHRPVDPRKGLLSDQILSPSKLTDVEVRYEFVATCEQQVLTVFSSYEL